MKKKSCIESIIQLEFPTWKKVRSSWKCCNGPENMAKHFEGCGSQHFIPIMPLGRNDVVQSPLKPLYMANSMEELKTKCATPKLSQDFNKQGDKLANSMITTFKEAISSLNRGDEERAYILYTRTAEIYNKLQKSKSADMKYLNAMYSLKEFKETIINLEKLNASLSRRYDAMQTLKAKPDDQAEKPNNYSCSGDDSKKEQQIEPTHDLVTNNVIKCTELYKLINDLKIKSITTKDVPPLLILDVRPSIEYSKSRIDEVKLKNPCIVVLNIPGEILVPGTTWKNIESKLSPDTISHLKKRKTAEKVVILDYESKSKEVASPEINCLYDALWKWDQSKDRCSTPPSVLQGGFDEWLITYPQFTTDPRYKFEPIVSTPTVTFKINYDFDEEDEGSKKSPSPVNSKVSSIKSTPLPNGIVNGNGLDITKSWTKPSPGGARPVTVPDRSTKPKPDSPAQTAKVDKVNQELKKVKLDDEVDVNQVPRKSPTIPRTIENQKPIEIPPPSSPDMKPRSTDRTLSESVPKAGLMMHRSSSGQGGLSRSYSSPNIAQLLEETAISRAERRASVAAPRFDRSLKPSMLVSSKPAKHRNFAPVYGSLPAKFPGLRNLGNTCFMSAVIQCLSSTVDLGGYFLGNYRRDINAVSKFGSGGELAEELAELIKIMWSGQYKSLSPKDLKEAVGRHLPGFVGCDQQDSHEFLTMLLEKVHSDLNTATETGPVTVDENLETHLAINKFWKSHRMRNMSIISDIFEGLLLSTLECTVCGKKSDSFETFTCLSLPIPSGNRITINDCFKLFSEYERMSGEAAWDCPTCKCKRDAVKRIQVCRLPKVMVIHLKRFSYEGMWRHKLTTVIDYPVSKLDVKNYMYASHGSTNTLYDLYGVVCHTGTMEGGHYVSLCKNPESSSWFKFDDHEVSEVSSTYVKSNPAAYVLFYTSTMINGTMNFNS